MNRRYGFTLIELLVVIAIIAILAAILFPVFMNVKKKALESTCSSNLKQVGIATAMYMGDNDSRYPPYRVASDGTGTQYDNSAGWYDAARRYSKTAILCRCPADRSKLLDDGITPAYWSNVYTNYWSGYAPGSPPSPMETVIVHKRSTVFLMDGTAEGANGVKGQHSWYGPPTCWAPTFQPCIDAERRHSGAANVLFCDWHVKMVRPQDFKTDRTDASDNPLEKLLYKPTAPWNQKNDGHNPWFRGD